MSSFQGSEPPHGWQPRTWLMRLFELNEEQAASASDGGYYLVVRLDQFSSGLAEGLKSAEANSRPAPAKSKLAAGTLLGLELMQQGLLSAPPAPRAPDQGGTERFEALLELRAAECYVVPLRKRTLPSHSSGVTVGRTADNDIPLQHPSVSKFHATLEGSGPLYLTDLGSTNRTSLNGAPVQARREVFSGDTIKFGAVHCVVCTAAGLWHTMHAPRAS